MSATVARCCTLLTSLGVAVAALPAATASADDLVAEVSRDTPISAYGGALAWSGFDYGSKHYSLIIRQGDATLAAPIPHARRPFDVSLGPDARGRVVALYTRCGSGGHGCDVYRYDLATRRERKLAAVSSPSLDEAWPAQWRDRVTFVRRARAHVVSAANHRVDPRGRGPLVSCDVPYVKTLSSRAASRALDRSQCGSTVGMAIRGDAIVQVTELTGDNANWESQVRGLRATGGAARVLTRTGSGEGGYSPFVSPNLSASAVWLTRTGYRPGEPYGFLRVGLASHRLTAVVPNLNLAGRVARDERGGFWYLQGPEPDIESHGEPPFCISATEPCHLVRASASPFSTTARTLLARVTVDATTDASFDVPAASPFDLTGTLTRLVVRKGEVAARQPVPGVALDLLRADVDEHPGPFTASGLTTTTDATGRWTFTLPQPPPLVLLAVLAPALKAASTNITLSAHAAITLTATAKLLGGTVTPAQPGRSVTIQRLLADQHGNLPDGQHVCEPPLGSNRCVEKAWRTVVKAPLDAAGSAFSATVADAGSYRALLPEGADPSSRATPYPGLSELVVVAG